MEPHASQPTPRPEVKSPGRVIAVLGIILFAGLLIGGTLPRLEQKKNLKEDTADINNSVKSVNVTSPHFSKTDALELPGNIRALEETQLFARTNGYLSQRYVDIGSRVKRGDLLAEIASPDVDQQEFQAKADQAKAVASVGQSQADVANKKAGVDETESEVARARAGVEQAKAAVAGSQSRVSQTRAALAGSIAKVAQARHILETQRAALKQAEAQRDLAKVTAKRYETLLAQGFVAQQDADQAEATAKTTAAAVDSATASISAGQADVDAALQDVESSKALVKSAEADLASSEQNVTAAQAALSSTKANVTAARANVGASQANLGASVAQVRSNVANTQRFSLLRSFSKIVAPFDGVITLRNADVGSLVAPGDASNPKLSLFSMARVDILRIQVAVPQTYFQDVRPGTKATILVRELPGRKFEGTVFQNAGAVDPGTRTLLAEVRVNNKDNVLLPGMYAQVEFERNGTHGTIRVPASALQFTATGPRVVVVEPGSILKFVDVTIGRDFGVEVEITKGLTGSEQLVDNPTDDLKDGETVQVLATPKKGGK